jgi:hypothetical protein
MWRFLAGVGCALLLVGGGMLIWQGIAQPPHSSAVVHAVAPATTNATEPLPDPPQATEATKEQRRFNRYDHDRNGTVSAEEYLAARHKAFAKLDANKDGKLSFDEWAVKARSKFADADADRNALLTPAEFATTRVVRKISKPQPCVPEAD